MGRASGLALGELRTVHVLAASDYMCSRHLVGVREVKATHDGDRTAACRSISEMDQSPVRAAAFKPTR